MNFKNAFHSFFQNRTVLISLRWAIACVFAYAGFMKIVAPQNFADSIASFVILPNILISPVALFLPPFEILLALALAVGIQRRPALLGIVILLTVFMGCLVSAGVRGIAIDCGCFGSDEPSIAAAWLSLLRDIPILAAALWLYWVEYFQLVTIKHSAAPAKDDRSS